MNGTLDKGILGETDGEADGGWLKNWSGEKRELALVKSKALSDPG